MKIKKGVTVKDLARRAGVTSADAPISLLRPADRATDKEILKARESLKRRCPYLFERKKS
jgi:hypothetical protein